MVLSVLSHEHDGASGRHVAVARREDEGAPRALFLFSPRRRKIREEECREAFHSRSGTEEKRVPLEG